AAGLAIAASGIVRDAGSSLAASGALGEAMSDPSIGYLIVYHIEIALLFATLVAIGPLVRDRSLQPASRVRSLSALSTSST
ncbi:MFS transporter, partial [Methylobacterium sp. WL122]